MDEINNQYIKFMSDIIDSGLWGKLSPAAKTLYPVLLKFSDQNFKQVWPSMDTLLKLTGFRTKKSITLGKKELIKEGLLQCKPGNGRTNSTYYFSFNYNGSKITPLWDKKIPPSGMRGYPSEGDRPAPLSSPTVSPNHLNITINNTQTNKLDKEGNDSYDKLMERYGFNLVESAIQIAKGKGLERNVSYIAGVCRNLSRDSREDMPVFNQDIDTAQHVIDSWKRFLDWSASHLTRSSVDILKKIPIAVDGQSIFIEERLTEFLKQIIVKYFNEEVRPAIVVVFSEVSSQKLSL